MEKKKDARVPRSRKPNRAEYRKAVTAVFIAVIAFFLILFLIIPDSSFSESENRNLQMLPAANFQQFSDGRLAEKWGSYAADQFPFRDFWVSLRTAVDLAFGKREENGVFLAKDGSLIQTASVPDPANEAAQISALKDFHDRHAELPQYFLLAPNAVSILKDRLPDDAPTADQNASMDSFLEEVKNAGLVPVDVRKSLQANADKELYYRTDHHWTTEGAHLAFRTAAGAMGLDPDAVSYRDYEVSEGFTGSLSAKSGIHPRQGDSITVSMPGQEGTAASDYVVEYVEEKEKSSSFYDSDALKKKDKYTLFFGGNHSEIRIRTTSADSRRLLVLKDSYANCLIPYLAPYYREILVVDPRYCYESVDTLISAEEIDEVLFLYNANTLFEDRSLSSFLAS